MIRRIWNLPAVWLVLACTACSPGLREADYAVIPAPLETELLSQETGFLLQNGLKINYDRESGLEREAVLLQDYVRRECGIRLQTEPCGAESAASGGIQLVLDPEAAPDTGIREEAYRLSVSAGGVRISAPTPAGIFYGIQTLRKSLNAASGQRERGPVLLPAAEILDAPRFAWRGAMLDVSRHFFPVEDIKEFIDMLALHNINRFHWHLTDDQGWRIEIKRYPALTGTGSRRSETVIGHNSGTYDGKPYGGYYTQDEIREVVAYAAQRHITVVPEIDMPGHMLAALTAFPELGCTGGPYAVWRQWGVSEDVLCAGNPQTLEFACNVLDEVMELFPSEYIHIGGDECPKTRWEACPVCQAKIRELGLTSDGQHTPEMRLQSWFISRVGRHLAEKGRRMIGWDEILEGGLASGATVMSWRGNEGAVAAANAGHDAVLSPTSHFYFDYYQSTDRDREPMAIGGYIPVERVYSYHPPYQAIDEDKRHHLLGIQANLWTEYIPDFRQVQYMELPRMAALCEVQWSDTSRRDYAGFLERLPSLIRSYDANRWYYATHLFDVQASFRPDVDRNELVVRLSTLDDAPIYYTLDGSDPARRGMLYTGEVRLDEDCILQAVVIRDKRCSRVFREEISFSRSSLRPVVLSGKTHPAYTFNGAELLVDGLKGGTNYKTGRWLGFYREDMDVTVDLQQETEISRLSFQTCVEPGDWIFDTRGVTVSVSADNREFRTVVRENYPTLTPGSPAGIYVHRYDFEPVRARYVRVQARVEQSLPEWHGGKGYPAFLFVDEIEVR